MLYDKKKMCLLCNVEVSCIGISGIRDNYSLYIFILIVLWNFFVDCVRSLFVELFMRKEILISIVWNIRGERNCGR